VSVLRDISLDIRPGEVLTLLGENGAGKSTIIKIVAGIHQPDGGTIEMNGQPVHFRGIHQAEAAGVSTIHQELNNVPQLSVAENILLGRLPTRRGLVRKGLIESRARAALARVGMQDIDVNQAIGELGVAHQQLIEIARALDIESQLLILDEPTAALTRDEIGALFTIMDDLRRRGVAMIFISHHLEEVARVSDRVAVLRDGELVDTVPANTPEAKLVRLMVGREISDQYPRRHDYSGPETVLLEVRDLTRGKAIRDVSFTVRAGEVVGLAGLVGAGRTELLRAIAGADPYDSGTVTVDGRSVPANHIRQAIADGVGLVPEDRKIQGLVPQGSVEENIGYATIAATAHFSLVDRSGQHARAGEVAQRLRIRMRDLAQPVQDLSGGNQQKVIFARWAQAGSRVLLLDEPTRGVDVGARVEIYEFINQMTKAGAAVVMASSDLPEVLGMSDRILVMNNGRIAGEMPAAEATQDAVMNLAVRDLAAGASMRPQTPPNTPTTSASMARTNESQGEIR
jgi:ribose transport system ATP-binding protein